MKKYQIIFKKWRQLIDFEIKKILLDSVNKQFQEPVYYQIKAGGKRLRPILTIVSCLVCKGKIKHALSPAAGLEILHNCTLIYDDMIDSSRLRRGKLTVWAKFGKSIAECIGIDYSVSIFQAANKSKYHFEVSKIFARTMKELVNGEILDILFEQSGRKDEKYIAENRYKKVNEKNYFEMIGNKTASLVQSCCEVGGLVAGAKKSEITALKNYGFNAGIAFQIRDDFLDIFGEEKKFGKKIGKDIEERKLGNIVIFYALEQLNKTDKNKLLKILRKNIIKNKDINQAVKLIEKTKAQEKTILLGEKYAKEAKKNLKKLPQNKWNEFLVEFVDFAIKREK